MANGVWPGESGICAELFCTIGYTPYALLLGLLLVLMRGG